MKQLPLFAYDLPRPDLSALDIRHTFFRRQQEQPDPWLRSPDHPTLNRLDDLERAAAVRSEPSSREGSLRLSGEGAIFKRTSMPRFAEFLSGLGSIQRPVLDQTSLQGAYDFTLSLSDSQPDATKPIDKKAFFTWPSIFQDVQDLGLKLESRKAPVSLLIVDHMERPSQN